MAKFLIEWGFRDEILIKDVIEAVDIDAAIKVADHMAEDLWASNKTFAAKPYGDKHGQPRDDNLSSDGGSADIHADRRGASGGL